MANNDTRLDSGPTTEGVRKRYAKRKERFELDIKRVIFKHYDEANTALPESGGYDPSEFGFLDDEDMAKILKRAAKVMARKGSEAPLDYLFHRPPALRK